MNTQDNSTQFEVDLTNCDREPIHLLGRIQSVGFLVATSTDWLVRFASANTADFVGVEAEELLGEPLDKIFTASAIHTMRGRLQLLTKDGSERVFCVDLLGTEQRFDVALHISDDSVVIEAEPAKDLQAVNSGALVRTMLARIQKAPDLAAIGKECVRQLRAFTGFDRVMLYRFNSDGAGSVIAESVVRGRETFLGLNYPATDIPKQARALYVRNSIRLIADVGDPTVAIVPSISPEGEPLDLSMSLLRAVSPIHIEYLTNMGVGASMSVSIVIEGRLWGLFALHHYSARHLPMEMRSALELFGQMSSLIIEGRLYREAREAEDAARALHDRFINKVVNAAPSIAALADHADDLREFIPCDGFCIWARGEARSFGHCPSSSEVAGLARFLNRAASSRIYATDEIGAVYPKGQAFSERAAGVLAIPISRAPRDYLLFFRSEIVQTVHWAGNPNEKEAVYGPNGSRLSPRKSFETWKETVRGKSLGWSESEKKVAESLRVSLLEILLKVNEESERQQNLASQHQELLIAELNHRVRNILSLIRALVKQSKPDVASVDEFASIISGRIEALARAHDQVTKGDFAAQDFSKIIETEFEAYTSDNVKRLSLDGPTLQMKANAFSVLALVFHELVTNSAKYGALSAPAGMVRVKWEIDPDGCCVIEWTESGGPAVAPPKRRGFGSTIVERSIPHDLGGEARIEYRLSGVRARFALPPASFKLTEEEEEEPLPRKGSTDAPRASAGPAGGIKAKNRELLHGKRGLIVEDNMIIALDTEELLQSKGVSPVFTASTVGEAREIIKNENLDFALLDVNLGQETSFGLIPVLRDSKVPFVFLTGYGDSLDLPEAGRDDVETIKKPFAGEEVVAALDRALNR